LLVTSNYFAQSLLGHFQVAVRLFLLVIAWSSSTTSELESRRS
jgi:hypothetical protein